MRTWIRPMVVEECYVSNESIADSVTACYKIACDVGRPYKDAVNYSNGAGWNDHDEYGGVFHKSTGTGNCSDPNSNRVLTNGMTTGSFIQEKSSDQGWINGQIETITLNNGGNVGPGARVYWYTVDKGNTRRWNHTGIIQQTDPSHPNHS